MLNESDSNSFQSNKEQEEAEAEDNHYKVNEHTNTNCSNQNDSAPLDIQEEEHSTIEQSSFSNFIEEEDKYYSNSSEKEDQNNESNEDYCPICLLNFQNKALIKTCLHMFCLDCILKWSIVSRSCPLCKLLFDVLIHDIQSPTEFIEKHLEPLPQNTQSNLDENYRHSLTFAQRSRGGGNRRSLDNRSWWRRRTYGRRQPFEWGECLTSRRGDQNIVSSDDDTRARRRRRRTDALDNVEEHKSTLKVELGEEGFEKRLWVYATKSRAKCSGPSGQSKIRDLNPSIFQSTTATNVSSSASTSILSSNTKNYYLNLLAPWIERELMVILRSDDIDMVKNYVFGVMQRHELTSDTAKNLLKEFLGECTELFVHELISFANSPWNLETYDRYVEY